MEPLTSFAGIIVLGLIVAYILGSILGVRGLIPKLK